MTIPDHVHILNPNKYTAQTDNAVIASIIQIKNNLIIASGIYSNKIYNIDYIAHGLTSPKINQLALILINNRKNILLNYLDTANNFKPIELINDDRLEQICNNSIYKALEPFIKFRDKFNTWFKSRNGKLEIHNMDGINIKSGDVELNLNPNGHFETNAKTVTATAENNYKINAAKIELN